MTNRIELANNLDALSGIPLASIPLVYLDPPFNTGKRQTRTAFRTTRSDDGDRTGFAGRRDQTVVLGSHAYADAFDAYRGFLEPRLNEIIWAYDYGGRPRDRWPAKHDRSSST